MIGLIRIFTIIILLGFAQLSYASSNANTLLPEIKALALDKLVLDRTNTPVTVLETPAITDENGKVAQGMTRVNVTLAEDAKSAIIIQGKPLKPGQSIMVVQDLSVTGGVIKIPFYPETANVEGISHYSLDIPNITAEICPESYAIDSATNSCTKVNTSSLLYSCPGSQWTYSDDVTTCTKQTEIPKTTCPVGFDSNGDGTCTKTEYKATVAKCSTGYAYSIANDQCEKTLTVTANKTCSDPNYSFFAATNDCRKTITKTVSYDCTAGYSYNSSLKVCERTLTANASPICSSGYSYSATNKRCERTVTQTAGVVCSSGYTYSVANRRCEKALSTTATPICSNGYSYSTSHSRCEKTVSQTASKICSSGYTYSATNNRCEKTNTAAATPVCVSGYTYSTTNKRCEKTVTQTASKVCASGYTYSSANDRCEKTASIQARSTCPSGTIWRNGICKKFIRFICSGSTDLPPVFLPSETFCQDGVALDDQDAIEDRVDTIVCENVGWGVSSCYETEISLNEGYSARMDIPQSGEKTSNDGWVFEEVAKKLSCSYGYTLSGSNCVKTEIGSYSYSCPQNYSLTGSTCSQLLTASNTYSCPSASYKLSGSSCNLLQARSFSYSCSDSSYTLSGSSCSKLLTASNSWSCSAGWSLSGSTCYSTATLSNTYSCPAGYINHNNGTCTQLQNTANTWNCLTGYANHNNGSCSLYQANAYSLSCADSAYSPNTTTEICEKVLTTAHSYQCGDPNYTLSGSSCSLLLTETEEWVCDDISYGKISETQCRKETNADLVGSCPSNFVKSADGRSCEYSDATPLVDSCAASFSLQNGECVKDVFEAPSCSSSIVDSSCTCDDGMILNTTTYQCEGVEKSSVQISCPNGYYAANGQCEYHKSVDIVYDFCPLGMLAQSGKCILKETISPTQSCNSPYSVQGTQCKYTDSKPMGYVVGIKGETFEGDIKTELSSITLKNSEFDAIVSEISEIALDDFSGCRMVSSAALAKGEIRKGDVPCFVKWTSLPEGITGIDNKISGIFKRSGPQVIEYSLLGFDGNKLTEFEIANGSIDLVVNEPPKPAITDVTTRLMSKVVTGFDMYNYSADSKLSISTIIVEPRNYIQKVTVDDIGTCDVLIGNTSCTIFSSVAYTKDPTHLQTDSNYIISANSKVGGWDDVDLLDKDWVIHHDFRGPNIVFAEFNPSLENTPIINNELNFPMVVSGGEAAVGVRNIRAEVDLADKWWMPSRVELIFTAQDGSQTTNIVTVNGDDIVFDLPNSTSSTKTLTSQSNVDEGFDSAYAFDTQPLTPGKYDVQVVAKDAFNNQSTTVYENIEIDRPLPQIKVVYKHNSIEKNSSVQTVNMLDDLTVVAHNGISGDSKITSIKIDGRNALTTNSETYFKTLTGEGFELDANTSYVLDVEVEDLKGRTTALSLPFNYLQMTFAINHKPVTVIQKVEDVALTVNRTRGMRCDLYGTKSAAALASNDYNYACYIDWTDLPVGLEPDVTTYQSKLSGAVQNLGVNSVSYDAYIVHKNGRASKISSETVSFEAIEPLPLELELDDKLKLSEGVYSVPVNNSLLGRYRGQSSRAHVDVRLSNENGDEKFYKHNQLPFGEIQTFSAYAERLGEAVLWDKIGYTLKANYRLAPELNIEKNFDLIVTPHPYMQVLMDLDSPQYASTETINASIKLGLRNNATGQFEYSEDSMGSGWDVFIAFKNGKVYEPITETIEIDSSGVGSISLDANIIFERNQAIYAVARAKSPYPEITVERVSIPRSITVVKGTAVDGKVVSRVVHSRIPANFDVRYDTSSYDDLRVLGDIHWQFLNDTGSWVEDSSLDNRRYISIKSTSPETIKVRASVTNKVTGVETTSDEATLISFDVPNLKIVGTNQAISGQEVELSALDNNETPQPDAIVEWSLDNGETWEPGGHTYHVVVAESTLKVKARMKYANTASEITQGQWREALKYVSVTKPKALTVMVAKPSIVEVGTEIELKLKLVNPFAATGVEALSEWILPDGSVIKNQETLTYLVKEDDLDESKRLNMKARAWLDGYKDVTLGESIIVMNSFSYTFPSDDQLSLSINNNVKFVPSTGYATLNMPILNAPGVVFSYEWTFDEDAIEKTVEYGKSMNFKVIKAGIHKITLVFSDNRGNFTYIDGFVDAMEPAPLEFKVTDVFSNKYMRTPLTVSLYPSVKTSHPYDFMKEYLWTINGETKEPSSRAIGVFEELDAGHYDVELEVTSNFGQKGTYTMSFDVKNNLAPVCEPVVREQYGTHIVDANCKDSDGTISYYRWVVNGTVFSPYGAQVRFSENDFPTATIVIEAVDDAGAKGIGQTNF